MSKVRSEKVCDGGGDEGRQKTEDKNVHFLTASFVTWFPCGVTGRRLKWKRYYICLLLSPRSLLP